jgi:photosystem II stability/assembly factor-like uncharacterized protein
VTSPTSSVLTGVTYGNNNFVAVGDDATIVRSTDNGTTWDNVTSATISSVAEYWLNEVTFGNNTFVAVGGGINSEKSSQWDGTIVRSTDNGSSWENVTPPGTYGDITYIYNSLTGVTFGNNTFVAVSDGNFQFWRSTDNGSSFSGFYPSNQTSKNHLFYGITFGNNTFVAVGYDYNENVGAIIRSTDNGLSWENVTYYPTVDVLFGVGFGNNTFVAVGNSGNIVRSTDNGATWENATSPTSPSEGTCSYESISIPCSSHEINYGWDVTFGNNTFVAVGNSGTIYTSSDNGSSFDNVTSPTANDLIGITF